MNFQGAGEIFSCALVISLAKYKKHVRFWPYESYTIQRPPKHQKKGDDRMDASQARHLVDTYADMILRLSYSYLKQTYDAEDICQTVFLKYLSGDFHFESAEHEKAWIIRSTINACKDHLKSGFFRRTAPLEEAEHIPAPQAPNTEILEALKKLPEKYRLSLYLYYYEEYSTREIASIMGKNKNTVSAYLSRGRRKLREYLDQERSIL